MASQMELEVEPFVRYERVTPIERFGNPHKFTYKDQSFTTHISPRELTVHAAIVEIRQQVANSAQYGGCMHVGFAVVAFYGVPTGEAKARVAAWFHMTSEQLLDALFTLFRVEIEYRNRRVEQIEKFRRIV